MVKPPLDGAVMAGYGTDSGIPAFQCTLQQDGYFLAVGFESGFYFEQPDSSNLTLAGPVYLQLPPPPDQALVKTRPPRPLPARVNEAISSLKSKRLDVAHKIEGWDAFSDWQLGIVRQRQIGLYYNDVEVDQLNYCLCFAALDTEEHWKKFKSMRSFGLSVMPLLASKSPEQWEPVENARGVSLGEFSPPKKQIARLLSNNRNAEGPLSDIIEISIDPDIWDKVAGTIAEQGFLVSDIFQNEIPIKRQKEAIQKLIRGEAANPRLADFLFDATKARILDAPVFGLDETDLAHLHKVAPSLKLNEKQELAVAKALATPDIFLNQGPPATGKTTVLAAVCILEVKRGKLVLISSQSNIAVDKILDCLPGNPNIRPLRSGRKDSQSKFSDDQALDTYLASVHKTCNEALTGNRKLAADIEKVEHIWPQFADMVSDYSKLKKTCATAEKKIKTTDGRLADLNGTISKLKEEALTYSSAIDALEQAIEQLNSSSAVTDIADWVRLINMDQRTDVFGPLKTWQQNNSLPQALKKLLTGLQPGDDNQQSDSADQSWIGNLLQWFAKRFVRKHEDAPDPEEIQPPKEIKPNWAVVWINEIALLNQLRELQPTLPPLLDSCMEVERLCTAAGVSKVSDEDWSKVTSDLHHSLKACENIAEVLSLDDIATSLRPNRRFGSRLAETRRFLQKTITSIPPFADRLQKILTDIAEASVKYLSSCSAETDKQTRQTQSTVNSLRHKQNGLAVTLADANGQIKQLEIFWSEAFNSLPADLRARINNGTVPIGRKALQVLNKALACYRQDSREQLDNHRLWGPVQERWLGLLENLTETDKKRLQPVYLDCCNVAALTCSWSGNRKHFLSRHEKLFDVVIIDEVSKATPPELLMPALLAKKVILGGDYRQLPPVFKEGRNLERSFNELDELGVDRDQIARFSNMVTASLFKQLYHDSPDALKQYFDIQFRMHPQIMQLINQFYDKPLLCGIKEPDKECDHGLIIQTHSGDFLTRDNHVLWVDTSYDDKGRPVYEQQAGTSKVNQTEAEAVVQTVKLLNEAAGRANKTLQLALITFYGRQVRLIKDKLDKLKSNQKKFLNIRLSTVDDFQGLESEIVIVSLVRSKPGRIGSFAKQYERINVAMSRAQGLLIILGATKTFAKVDVPLPTADGKTVDRRCYQNIIDIVKRYGGMRSLRDLL